MFVLMSRERFKTAPYFIFGKKENAILMPVRWRIVYYDFV